MENKTEELDSLKDVACGFQENSTSTENTREAEFCGNNNRKGRTPSGNVLTGKVENIRSFFLPKSAINSNSTKRKRAELEESEKVLKKAVIKARSSQSILNKTVCVQRSVAKKIKGKAKRLSKKHHASVNLEQNRVQSADNSEFELDSYCTTSNSNDYLTPEDQSASEDEELNFLRQLSQLLPTATEDQLFGTKQKKESSMEENKSL